MLIDGHSLAFRAFYALPVDSFQTRDGQHTNAIHGFLSMLLLLLQNEKPTHLAVAFDVSRQSFRTRDYEEYKGNRAETPPEFGGQVPLLQEALTAMNVPILTKDDFEADDVLATLATRGAEDGFAVSVVSGDRDTIQLVTDDITLLYPNARGVSELKKYDPAAVRERYGIEPEQYPDIAALVGETSDNLSGIDKVGEKTAVKWVLKYGGLEGVLEHADEITGVVGQNLRDQRDRAIRNRRLNRLVRDLELPYAPGDLERRPLDMVAVREVFDRLQFRTLLERLGKIAGVDGGGAAPVVALQSNATAPEVRTLAGDELAAWLAERSAEGEPPLAVQVEQGPGGVTGVGLSTATESVHAGWSPSDPTDGPLPTWLASDAPKALVNAKRQLKALAGSGLALGGVAFDTSIAAWLLRPGTKPADLRGQVYDFLGETLPEQNPNQLVPEGELGPATEAWYVTRIIAHLRPRLEEAGLDRVLAQIDLPLVPVLARMELTGVTANPATLARLNGSLSATAGGHAADAFGVLGREVNLGSPKQLQQVLFEDLQMPRTRSTKTGYSTDAASLADLQEQLPEPHPFLTALQAHRDATKLKQIVETLERSIGADGRIHTSYDLTGTSTGRISSNDPNLQNIPIRADEGREIRTSIESGAGFETLLTADYSQIEMRIMAHLSGDDGLIEAFNAGEDLHRFVGSRVFGVAPADVTAIMRTKVKAMSYGLAYGLSAFGLSKQLRIDTSEARGLMAEYFARFGAVRDYLRNVVEQARVDGYTETIYGRRRPFGDLNSPNRVLRENAERAALNAPIQGSAADIIKIAMLGIAGDLEAQGLQSRMLLQVHDELVFEVATGELDALTSIVTERMRGAADLRVPLDVQVGTGPNWDAAAH